MKIKSFTFGKMIAAEDKNRGTAYIDWRCGFVDIPRLIVFCESESKPDGGIICFYPYDDLSLLKDNNIIAYEPAHFHTSVGNITENGSLITIDTAHSRYLFEEDDFDLAESDKEFLMVCAGIDIEDIQKST